MSISPRFTVVHTSPTCAIDLTLMHYENPLFPGIETSILLVTGPELSGKSSLLSRGQTLAFDWFNGLCCIVYRQIGQTIDSTSSSLLLRSICLQLSYAYGTDPNAIPNVSFLK